MKRWLLLGLICSLAACSLSNGDNDDETSTGDDDDTDGDDDDNTPDLEGLWYCQATEGDGWGGWGDKTFAACESVGQSAICDGLIMIDVDLSGDSLTYAYITEGRNVLFRCQRDNPEK